MGLDMQLVSQFAVSASRAENTIFLIIFILLKFILITKRLIFYLKGRH